MLTPKKETLAQKNARMRKEIAAREKRIADKAKEDEKNSSSNQRANRVIGNYKTGGTTQCAKCGGQKMAKGGTKLAAAGIPYAIGAGQTDGKNGMMKKGGQLKKVPTSKVGLAKLPTAVRNKMGYQKKGGLVKKANGGQTVQDKSLFPGSELVGFLGAGLGTALAARRQNNPQVQQKQKERIIAREQKRAARKSK